MSKDRHVRWRYQFLQYWISSIAQRRAVSTNQTAACRSTAIYYGDIKILTASVTDAELYPRAELHPNYIILMRCIDANKFDTETRMVSGDK